MSGTKGNFPDELVEATDLIPFLTKTKTFTEDWSGLGSGQDLHGYSQGGRTWQTPLANSFQEDGAGMLRRSGAGSGYHHASCGVVNSRDFEVEMTFERLATQGNAFLMLAGSGPGTDGLAADHMLVGYSTSSGGKISIYSATGTTASANSSSLTERSFKALAVALNTPTKIRVKWSSPDSTAQYAGGNPRKIAIEIWVNDVFFHQFTAEASYFAYGVNVGVWLDNGGAASGNGPRIHDFAIYEYTPVKPKLVFLGDSLTSGTTLSTPGTDNWAYQLCNVLNAEYINLAVGGDTVGTALAGQVRSFESTYAAESGLTVVYFFGVNDLDRGSSPMQVFRSYQELFRRLKAMPQVGKVAALEPTGFQGSGGQSCKIVRKTLQRLMRERHSEICDELVSWEGTTLDTDTVVIAPTAGFTHHDRLHLDELVHDEMTAIAAGPVSKAVQA